MSKKYVPPNLTKEQRRAAEKEIEQKVKTIQKLINDTRELAEKSGLTFAVTIGQGGFELRGWEKYELDPENVEYYRDGNMEDGLYPIGEWYSSSLEC